MPRESLGRGRLSTGAWAPIRAINDQQSTPGAGQEAVRCCWRASAAAHWGPCGIPAGERRSIGAAPKWVSPDARISAVSPACSVIPASVHTCRGETLVRVDDLIFPGPVEPSANADVVVARNTTAVAHKSDATRLDDLW